MRWSELDRDENCSAIRLIYDFTATSQFCSTPDDFATSEDQQRQTTTSAFPVTDCDGVGL